MIHLRNRSASPVALICNLVMALLAYILCRAIFLAENWIYFANTWSSLSLANVFRGSFKSDVWILVLSNIVYAIMILAPTRLQTRKAWQRLARVFFIVVNSMAVAVNLCDTVYFQYTGKRTTLDVFSEFGSDDRLLQIVGIEIFRHWYLLLAFILIVLALVLLYFRPEPNWEVFSPRRRRHWYAVNAFSLLSYLSISFAMVWTELVPKEDFDDRREVVANNPAEVAFLTNTPFAMANNLLTRPKQEHMAELFGDCQGSTFTMSHNPQADAVPNGKNVVVVIMESFGREYVGWYNRDREDYKKGYTPFLDSLLNHCMTFEYSFSNARKSVDAMPSVLCSRLPINHVVTDSTSRYGSYARDLSSLGYYTGFFHGGNNGSMDFDIFAKAAGFEHYFGRTEYNTDSRFNGDRDFDGNWGVWDECFLQYYALKMSELPQPFCTTVFTLSSHHPFSIPPQYSKVFYKERGDDNKMHKCIRYCDNAFRKFFDTARKQDWFDNTIFIFTADHTSITSDDYYRTPLGVWSIPIFIYDPSGEIPSGKRNAIAQQVDIRPTILGAVGYNKPYKTFGVDLLHTADADTRAFNMSMGFYQYITPEYLYRVRQDGAASLYDYKGDWYEKNNLIDSFDQDELSRMRAYINSVVRDAYSSAR